MSDHFVIDPSVLIQAYVREPNTDNALALLDDLKQPTAVMLHAPEFCVVECTNILWRHVRFQEMPVEIAKKAVTNMTDLPLTIHLASAYLPDALSIGLTHELAVYDSIYIALAKALGFSMLTADKKQERVALIAGVTVKPITDFKPAS